MQLVTLLLRAAHDLFAKAFLSCCLLVSLLVRLQHDQAATEHSAHKLLVCRVAGNLLLVPLLRTAHSVITKVYVGYVEGSLLVVLLS